MTFAQIYGEVVDLRFNSQATKLAQVKKWVNAAELKVWNHADWNFKRMPATAITVTIGAGIANGSVPTDFDKAIRVYSPLGDELTYLPPDQWEANYAVGTPLPVGLAEAYTVIERSLKVGPAQAGSFSLSYRRRYTKRVASTPTLGVMSGDSDTPYWDSEHHYVLVPIALILGEKLEADPTAEGLRSERDELLASMVSDLVGSTENVPTYWGVG